MRVSQSIKTNKEIGKFVAKAGNLAAQGKLVSKGGRKVVAK